MTVSSRPGRYLMPYSPSLKSCSQRISPSSMFSRDASTTYSVQALDDEVKALPGKLRFYPTAFAYLQFLLSFTLHNLTVSSTLKHLLGHYVSCMPSRNIHDRTRGDDSHEWQSACDCVVLVVLASYLLNVATDAACLLHSFIHSLIHSMLSLTLHHYYHTHSTQIRELLRGTQEVQIGRLRIL